MPWSDSSPRPARRSRRALFALACSVSGNWWHDGAAIIQSTKGPLLAAAGTARPALGWTEVALGQLIGRSVEAIRHDEQDQAVCQVLREASRSRICDQLHAAPHTLRCWLVLLHTDDGGKTVEADGLDAAAEPDEEIDPLRSDLLRHPLARNCGLC